MSEHVIFDIETGPETDDVLKEMEPEFTAPANYKDAQKIADYIEDARAKWKDKAALSAETGRVLAIGMLRFPAEQSRILTMDDEAEMLAKFWAGLDHFMRQENNRLIGFDCKRFDLPFLVRRSFRHGLVIPACMDLGNRYGPRFIIDLAEVWQAGSRGGDFISLDRVAKFLGCDAKSGSGADFARLFAEDREAAIAYLEQDLRVTAQVARKMRIF